MRTEIQVVYDLLLDHIAEVRSRYLAYELPLPYYKRTEALGELLGIQAVVVLAFGNECPPYQAAKAAFLEINSLPFL